MSQADVYSLFWSLLKPTRHFKSFQLSLHIWSLSTASDLKYLNYSQLIQALVLLQHKTALELHSEFQGT